MSSMSTTFIPQVISSSHQVNLNDVIKRLNASSCFKDAFSLYNTLKRTERKYFVVNALLKIWLDKHDQSSAKYICYIYNDIMRYNLRHVDRKLLTKCCKSSIPLNVQSTVQMLYFINDIYAKSMLIEIYANSSSSSCDHALQNAVHIFDSIPDEQRDAHLLSAMMKCLIAHARSENATQLYENTRIAHNDVSHLWYLKACMKSHEYEKGKRVIDTNLTDVSRHRIECINTVIDFYAHFGDVDNALRMFDRIAHKTVITVGAMMKCYLHAQRFQDALRLFEQVQLQPIDIMITQSDACNLLYLKACISTNEYDKGRQCIETFVSEVSLKQHRIELLTTMIDFYAHFGVVSRALHVFHSIPSRSKDVVVVGAMLTCFVNNAQFVDAISLFEQSKGTHNDVTKLLYMKACIQCKEFGKAHSLVADIDLCGHGVDIALINTAIDLYGNMGAMDRAVAIFDSLPESKKDIVSVNVMLNAYIRNLQYDAALQLYDRCGLHTCDDTSHILYIKACSHSGQFERAHAVLDLYIDSIDAQRIELVTSIIDFYGHRGDVRSAESLFARIAEEKRNNVVMNVMMNIYCVHKQWDNALQLFGKIPYLARDLYAYHIALNACGDAVYVQKGTHIVSELQRNDKQHILHDCQIQAAIIRFYAKTRQLQKAIDMFENLDDVVLRSDTEGSVYCAIMDGFAKNGDMQKMFALFSEIKQRNPTQIGKEMYSIVLNGCAHSGDTDKAMEIFSTMSDEHRHDSYSLIAIIDGLGRKRCVREAEAFYNMHKQHLDLHSKFIAMKSILSACRTHNDTVTAQSMFAQFENVCLTHDVNSLLVNEGMRKHMESIYILMSNVHAQNHNFRKVKELRTQIKRKLTVKRT